MSYKLETIVKATKKMQDLIAKYESMKPDRIPMCISKGNKKIGKVLNVSLPPVLTCHHCKNCMYFCYDIKAVMQYMAVADARVRNYVILLKDRKAYFGRIRETLKRRRTNFYFRWHVSGDIIDIDYFAEMVKIAREFPHFIFWTYTKEYETVNRYVSENGGSLGAAIPENFHVMFSEWDGTPMDNRYSFPVFTCKLKAGNKNHDTEYFESLYKCPGNCDMCKQKCLGCIGGRDTYCNEH